MVLGGISRKDRELLKLEAQELYKATKAEAESWREKDKHLLAKQDRAKEKEAKADAKLAAKLEKKELEERENAANSTLRGANKGSRSQPSKVTQAELARRQALMATATKAAQQKSSKTQVVPQPKLEANTNRLYDRIEATGLEDALAALEGCRSGVTTFAEFEKRMEAELREEKPGLKMSQIREHVLKAWARSPENPKNACR